MINTLSDIIEKPNCSLKIELQLGSLYIQNAHKFIRQNASDKRMHDLLKTVLNNYDKAKKKPI